MGRRDNAFVRTGALLLLVIVVFGRIAGHEFVSFDDDKFIYANEKLLPPTARGLAHFWQAAHGHLYMPVTMTAWWVLAQAGLVRDDSAGGGGFALNPWVFHIASLLVHAANVLLVRRIVRAITRDDAAAVIGACLFAIHPLQTETVAWASELKDLLAAMFSLLAIAASIEATGAGGKRRWAWWGAAIVCFVAAMLSKPSAVTLPLIVAAVLWMCARGDGATGPSDDTKRGTQPSSPQNAARRRAIPFVLLLGLVLAAPVALITRAAQPASDVPSPALWARAIVAADALAFYLGKIVWPSNLTVDYGRTPAAIFASRAAYWTWIVPLVVTVVVVATRKRVLIGAWLIFCAAPAANLGLLPFDFQIVSTVADHYIYLGLLGVAIVVAWAVGHWPRLRAPVMVIILVLGVLAFMQAGRWRDSYALWRHAVAVNRESALAHGNLGATLLNDGNVAEALPMLTRAAELDPHDPFPQLNLIRAHLAAGDTSAAADSAENFVAAYRRRSDFDPELVAAVLERYAAAIAARGDAHSSQRLKDHAARLRNP